MVDETATAPNEANPVNVDSGAVDMDLVISSNGAKRTRDGEGVEEEDGDASKKLKVAEESSEEERLEMKEGEKLEEKRTGPVQLGPKSFGSSGEMFDYFYGLLHYWPPNLNLNKYEHMALLELLKDGHSEPEKKIGGGIKAFQVRFHQTWKSRCFFLIRKDGSADDFSFRKCVDHILPLPENLKIKADANKALGGRGRGGGGRGGYGRGRGRGGNKSRN